MSIIHYDQNGVKEILSNSEIKIFSNLIIDLLNTNINENYSVCIGLLMGHNVYIPSLIISLQHLNYAFIFLEIADIENNVVSTLKLNWLLSFDNSVPGFDEQSRIELKHSTLLLQKNRQNHPLSDGFVDVCCIVKTSGTTGESQFVKVENHCIKSNVECLQVQWKITKNDIIYFGTPLTFDPSLIELLLGLTTGAKLIITTETTRANPSFLYKSLFCHNNPITVLQIVPSVFLRWPQSRIQSILNSNLRILAFGGEQFPVELQNYTRSETLRVFNLYGITEVSCWATLHEVKDHENIPIGNELAETVVELRDENGTKVFNGDGEIFIGSSTRICQIIGESEQMKPIFRGTGDIGKIIDQTIYYQSRKTEVIKRYGHRINLTKIEQLIRKETNLKNKMIWCQNKRLLNFVVIDGYNEATKEKILDKLRIKLLHCLPKESFPDFIELLPQFPLTRHGKINKKALEDIYLNQHSSVDNPAHIFRILWSKFLNLESNNSENCNFFELGGNSILAIQLLENFKDELNSNYPDELLENLFENTLKDCLECLLNFKPNLKRIEQSPLIIKEAKQLKTNIEMVVKWKYNLEACVDSSPLCFSNNKIDLVAVGSFSHIFCVLNTENGEEIAKFTLPEAVESSPCLSLCKNRLFVGCFDGKLYCIDYIKPETVWTFITGDKIKNTPIIFRNSIIFGSYDKFLYSISLDGQLLWKTHLNGGIVSNPRCNENDGAIYVATILGNCYRLSELGEIIWSFNCNRPIFGAPCFKDDSIVWGDVEGVIRAFSQRTGQKLWQYSSKGHLYSSLITVNDSIIFGCHDHNLYVLTVGTTTPQLSFITPLKGPTSSTPCIVNDMVLIATNCGLLYLINLSGQIVAELQMPNDIFSSPYFNGKQIFVGCRDNNLYCISVNKY